MFEHVDWQHGGEHMLAKHRVSGDEANEALSDPDRLVIDPDYNSSSGRTVRIIGYSETLDDLLAVIVIEDDGAEFGVNGWRANSRDRRYYRERWEA